MIRRMQQTIIYWDKKSCNKNWSNNYSYEKNNIKFPQTKTTATATCDSKSENN